MGSLERRLGNLETHADKSREDEEAAQSREVLKRMTKDELSAYVDVLRRMKAGEEPGEEDRLISRRVQELYEEVRNGH
jgi:hypothetical protein